MSTTVVDTAGTSTVTYLRDATGRVVSRTATPPGGPASTIRYLYAAGSLFGVATGAGVLIERDLSLPGGVSVSLPVVGGQSWSYPNLCWWSEYPNNYCAMDAPRLARVQEGVTYD